MVACPQSIQLPDPCEQVVLCGGPYSNFGAVEAFLTVTAHIPDRFCLGDLGGFGPLPNRTLELLRQADITCIQGNYDQAVGFGLRDCGCGYTDPRDRHFAQLSYDYTFAHTAEEHRQWLQNLPEQIVLEWRDRRILLCHGSPDFMNEFVWDSETDDARIRDFLARHQVDGICATHTGLPWTRTVTQASGQPGFWCNVGVLGRPAHEGKPHVYYGMLHFPAGIRVPRPELVPLSYDVALVTAAMRSEGLPSEFIESLERGIWTTCGDILPPQEKAVQPRLSEAMVMG